MVLVPGWGWYVLLGWCIVAVCAAFLIGAIINHGRRGPVPGKQNRFQRRLAERRTQQRVEEARSLKHPLGDPRIGDDRRQEERRVTSMSPQEVEAWLKHNGILGGDRRRGQRRQGDRRR